MSSCIYYNKMSSWAIDSYEYIERIYWECWGQQRLQRLFSRSPYRTRSATLCLFLSLSPRVYAVLTPHTHKRFSVPVSASLSIFCGYIRYPIWFKWPATHPRWPQGRRESQGDPSCVITRTHSRVHRWRWGTAQPPFIYALVRVWGPVGIIHNLWRKALSCVTIARAAQRDAYQCGTPPHPIPHSLGYEARRQHSKLPCLYLKKVKL